MSPKIPEEESVPAEPLRILIADDDPDDLELCLRTLDKSGINFQAETVSTKEDFAQRLREHSVDVVLSDYRMKGWTGMDALAIVIENRPEVPNFRLPQLPTYQSLPTSTQPPSTPPLL